MERRSGVLFRVYRITVGLVSLLLVTGEAFSRVIMDNTCQLTEDVYVVTLNDAKHVARAQNALENLESIYKLTGNYPHFLGLNLFDNITRVHDYAFHNKERQTRVALVVDPYSQNISLMIHSEHKRKDMTWHTDNQAFIDGKTNAYADFICSGEWVQLKWNGRDLASDTEFFDGSSGRLSARIESFTNHSGEEDRRLRVARFTLNYPRNGVAGKIGRFFVSLVEKRTPYPHSFNYVANTQGADPLVMTGKFRPGYEKLAQVRVNFDVEKLAGMEDESSSQNFLSPHMPVSPATARAALQRVKVLMTRNTSEQMRNIYSGNGLHALIEEADNSLLNSINSSGKERDVQLQNAARVLAELSSRSRQISNLASTNGTQDEALSIQRQANSLSQQATQILEHLAGRLEEQANRSEGLRAFQEQQAQSDGTLIDDREQALLQQEPDLFAQVFPPGIGESRQHRPQRRKPSAGATRRGTASTPANKEFLENCLMTQNQEGVFGYPMNDRHYGFDIGVEISLLANREWLVSLESTRTPWTMPLIHTYGSNYQVPAKDTWCRGGLFGVDHAQDNIRLTIRGVYDPVNNAMYTVSLWSIWDHSRVLGHTQGLLTAFIPGIILAGKLLVPLTGLPAALLLTSAMTIGTLAATPLSPPETRYAHIRRGTRFLAEHGMGDQFYTGSGRMDYYGSFSTLRPKGNLD